MVRQAHYERWVETTTKTPYGNTPFDSRPKFSTVPGLVIPASRKSESLVTRKMDSR